MPASISSAKGEFIDGLTDFERELMNNQMDLGQDSANEFALNSEVKYNFGDGIGENKNISLWDRISGRYKLIAGQERIIIKE